MNLKRIIREELEDLQWIKDIVPTPNNPQKGLIYQFYNYPDDLYNENIKTDNIIITAVVDDRVYFDTVDRYWANHPSDPGSDIMDKKAFSRMVNSGDIKYIGPSRVNESNELDWMGDSNIDVLQVGSILKDNTSEKGPYFIIRKIIGDTAYIEGVEEKKWKNQFYLETLMEMLDRGEIVYVGERLPINILKNIYPSYFN